MKISPFQLTLMLGITSLSLTPSMALAIPLNNYSQQISQTQPNYQPRLLANNNYTGILKQINDIAQQITVKIDNLDPNNYDADGSGVIIAKQGNTYYVLTARYLICPSQYQQYNAQSNLDIQATIKNCKQELTKGNSYQLITADGQKHQIDYSNVNLFSEQDLAVVQFTSNNNYQVATLANYELERDEKRWVFVAGFSGENNQDHQLKLSAGLIFSKEQALFERMNTNSIGYNGYDLLYTNISEPGMGGGAILDTEGRLIGINLGIEGINYGRSFGTSIGLFLSALNSTSIKSDWLKVETNKPVCQDAENNCLSAADVNLIKASLFDLTSPLGDNINNAEQWSKYGSELWRTFQYEKAIEAFDQAIKINERFWYAYYGKGLTLKDLGNYEEALMALEIAAKYGSQEYNILKEKALVLLQLDRKNEALMAINDAILINDKNHQQIAENIDFSLYIYQGQILADLGKYEQAISSFDKVIEIKPDDYQAWYQKGLIFMSLGKYEEAIANFNQVLQIIPDFPDVYYSKGIALMNLGKNEDAIASFNQAIQIKPDYADAWYNKGVALMNLGKNEEAINSFDQAIQINPDYADILRGRQ